MLSQFSYPIVCTEKFARSVAFYEDLFYYRPVYEMDGFSILKRKNWPDMYLAIMDKDHETIPEQYRQSACGMILNFPVHNVTSAYQDLYWEGTNIVGEPEEAPWGRKHFFVEDPNGILVDVAENIDIEAMLGLDAFRKTETESACVKTGE